MWQILSANIVEQMLRLGVVANVQPSFVPTDMQVESGRCTYGRRQSAMLWVYLSAVFCVGVLVYFYPCVVCLLCAMLLFVFVFVCVCKLYVYIGPCFSLSHTHTHTHSLSLSLRNAQCFVYLVLSCLSSG